MNAPHEHRLLLIGERDEAKRAHLAVEASIALYAQRVAGDVPFEWVQTDAVDARPDILVGATGMWCVPGSPYASTAGALRAIGYARRNGIPFIGTCGGFQHALMEYAGSVLHEDAVHAELEPAASSALIVKLSCSLVGAKAKVIAKPGGAYARLMGRLESEEEFNCNYGMAAAFEPVFEGSELEFVAHDDAGQVRVFWHRQHPFFVGSLFQPERRALSGEVHPLVHAFLERA